MKLRNIPEVQDFIAALEKTTGAVWLESNQGDKFNLKSGLSRYVALGQLIKNNGEDLELFCSVPEDEAYFMDFFAHHPDSV